MKNQQKPPKQKNNSNSHASSFRDPSGFVFFENNKVFRQINPPYMENYELLKSSGLYEELTNKGLLIGHKEKGDGVIEPEMIPFISYPYEWSFSQLKDAAVLTLEIQKIAVNHGMSLKDATSFNVQFLRGKPIFIDTLSFEKLEEGKPWVAYKQFCEQFLAPLAVTSYTDVRLNELLIPFINGIPLDLAAKLIPIKAKINPGILMHVVLHAGSQKKHADDKPTSKSSTGGAVNKNAMLGLIDSLERTVKGLQWKIPKMTWTDYGADDYFESYSKKTLEVKKKLVGELLDVASPKTAWDLGANTGNYSRIAASKGIFTVAVDGDPTVIEQGYNFVKESGEENILPLYVDLANPTPGIGFENKERDSFLDRTKPDLVMALALIHHLAISANLPMPRLAEFFSKLSKNLIIEFVPKEDPQTQRLLRSREDIFTSYTQKDFEEEFGKYFKVSKKIALPESKRTLYFMTLK